MFLCRRRLYRSSSILETFLDRYRLSPVPLLVKTDLTPSHSTSIPPSRHLLFTRSGSVRRSVSISLVLISEPGDMYPHTRRPPSVSGPRARGHPPLWSHSSGQDLPEPTSESSPGPLTLSKFLSRDPSTGPLSDPVTPGGPHPPRTLSPNLSFDEDRGHETLEPIYCLETARR